MLILVLTWLAVGISLVWLVKRGTSAGLPLAYFLGLSLIHVPGAILYLDGEELNWLARPTRVGFEQTIFGLVAFLLGAVIAKYAFVRRPAQQASAMRPQSFTSQRFAALDQLALIYLSLGSLAYFAV